MTSLACVSPTSCLGVGQYIDEKEVSVPTALTINAGVPGTALDIRLPGAGGSSALNSTGTWAELGYIACPTATLCVAVGTYWGSANGLIFARAGAP